MFDNSDTNVFHQNTGSDIKLKLYNTLVLNLTSPERGIGKLVVVSKI